MTENCEAIVKLIQFLGKCDIIEILSNKDIFQNDRIAFRRRG